MGIVNRRNAVVGWVVWNVGKRVAKRKAKSGGVLLFWRKKSGGNTAE